MGFGLQGTGVQSLEVRPWVPRIRDQGLEVRGEGPNSMSDGSGFRLRGLEVRLNPTPLVLKKLKQPAKLASTMKKRFFLLDVHIEPAMRDQCEGVTSGEEGTSRVVSKTVVLKMAQAKARIWP